MNCTENLLFTMGGGSPPHYDPLLLGGTPFVLQRVYKDKAWTIIFGLLYTGVFLGSFCAFKHA